MRIIMTDREKEIINIISPWMHYHADVGLMMLDSDAPEDVVEAYNEFRTIIDKENELRERMYSMKDQPDKNDIGEGNAF